MVWTSPAVSDWKARVSPLSAAALALCLTVGCVSLKELTRQGHEPKDAGVCQVVATWQPEVVFTPDPTHGGRPTPGLAGRLYLFGQEIGKPLVGAGTLVVDLYDDSAQARDAVLIEQWRLDRETLQRLLREDAIGWGYTLFLPWGTYRPEITQVRLRVRYDSAAGIPLYCDSPPLALYKGGLPGPPPVVQQTGARRSG